MNEPSGASPARAIIFIGISFRGRYVTNVRASE
jgi:hypothetical protein